MRYKLFYAKPLWEIPEPRYFLQPEPVYFGESVDRVRVIRHTMVGAWAKRDIRTGELLGITFTLWEIK